VQRSAHGKAFEEGILRKGGGSPRLGRDTRREGEASGARKRSPAQGERLAADGSGDPKKSSSLLREGKRVRFSFVHAQKALFPIAALCRLFEVSRQGYYAYAHPPPSLRVVAEAELCEAIRQVFTASGETY